MAENGNQPSRLDRIERALEKQGERVDALTQSLELLSRMHRNEMRRFDSYIERIMVVQERMIAVQERLTDIAGDHERRLRDREAGLNRLSCFICYTYK